MDRIAIEDIGIDGFELMQRAARFALRSLLKHWPDTKQLSIFCGGGNNGGDGYVMASLALNKGIKVKVYTLSPPEKLTGDAKKAYQMSLEASASIQSFDAESQLDPETRHVIVDAMLGTGLNSDVRGDYKCAINLCNSASLPIFAVDIPSGLSADQGVPLGTAIRADCTATFIGLKLGLFTAEGRHYAGDIVYDDLNVPAEVFTHFSPHARILDYPTLISKVRPRSATTHKGHCGHVLVIGGDHSFGGAVIMAAEAAARMGAGLTSVATQPEHCAALLARCPEVMVKAVSHLSELHGLLDKADVIVVGPGLGQSPWSEQMLSTALQKGLPCVLDADALNLLAKRPDWLPVDSSALIYTPHPGEAARLLKISTQDVQQDRLHAVETLQQRLGGSVLLKGSGSLLAHPSGDVYLCADGNPGMASGGMGDVLSGMIGGLLAQGFTPELSLNLAVVLHAKAADACAERHGERGILASDLIDQARLLLNQKTGAGN